MQNNKILKEVKRWFHPSTFKVSLTTRISNRGFSAEILHRSILLDTPLEDVRKIESKRYRGEMKNFKQHLTITDKGIVTYLFKPTNAITLQELNLHHRI